MDKKVVRKNTDKTVPKKTNVKKTTAASKKEPVHKKPAPVTKKPPVKKVVKETKPAVPLTECRYCKEKFEQGLTICPICRKNQKDQTGRIVIIVLLILLLISIIGRHFIIRYFDTPMSEEEYKYSTVLASYEELVRNPKDLKDKEVKVIGKVVKVEGVDDNFRNMMTVTIDANLFSGYNEHLINFAYTDYQYEIGFIEGDIITVYGKYKLINGNIPFIEAKYITFGS